MMETIEDVIEKIDNTLFMAEGPTSKMIPCETHLEGCIGMLKEIRNDMEALRTSDEFIEKPE